MAAANMTQAALQAAENVQLVANTGGATLLQTSLDSWISALTTGLDPSSIAHRTVLNWIPRGRELSASIVPNAVVAKSQGVAAQVALYVYRSCEAVAEAQSAGRITLAQANAIRAQYNLIFP